MFFLENLQKYLVICFVICGICLPPICVADEEAQVYEIGVGDILRINTWKEPDLSLEAAMVRSDGKITFPLLDDIQAQGISTMVLKTEIKKVSRVCGINQCYRYPGKPHQSEVLYFGGSDENRRIPHY